MNCDVDDCDQQARYILHPGTPNERILCESCRYFLANTCEFCGRSHDRCVCAFTSSSEPATEPPTSPHLASCSVAASGDAVCVQCHGDGYSMVPYDGPIVCWRACRGTGRIESLTTHF